MSVDLHDTYKDAGRRLAEHDDAFPPVAEPTELDRRAALLRSHLEWDLLDAGMALGQHLGSPREATLPIGDDQ